MDAKVTKTDLAVIDAALRLHNLKFTAAEAGVAINPSDAFFTPVVEVAVAVVEVCLVAYHVYNSWLTGADRTLAVDLPGQMISVKPTHSLRQLVEARNAIAKQLGSPALNIQIREQIDEG